jgi:predicted RecB family endonuclease
VDIASGDALSGVMQCCSGYRTVDVAAVDEAGEVIGGEMRAGSGVVDREVGQAVESRLLGYRPVVVAVTPDYAS